MSDLENINNCLRKLETVLKAGEPIDDTVSLFQKQIHDYYLDNDHSVILNNFFSEFLDTLVNNDGLVQYYDLCVVIMSRGKFSLVLEAILNVLNKKHSNYVTLRCIDMLELTIFKNPFLQFLSSCSLTFSASVVIEFETVLRLLFSVPDKFSKLKLLMSRPCFTVDGFGSKMSAKLVELIEYLSTVQSGVVINFSILGRFISLYCIRYAPKTFIPSFVTLTKKHKEDSFMKVCRGMFSTFISSNIESVFYTIIKSSPDPVYFYELIGNLMDKPIMCYLFRRKFILMYEMEENTLRIIIGYVILCYKNENSKLIDFLRGLMAEWSNSMSIENNPVHLHLNVTRSMLFVVSHIKSSIDESNLSELCQILITGVSTHLDNNNSCVRNIGILTAKLCLDYLKPSGPSFEYDISGIDMKSEFERLLNDGVFCCHLEAGNVNDDIPVLSTSLENIVINELHPVSALDQLDSDDEFVPFDNSSDLSLSLAKGPKYIQELIHILTESQQDPDKVKAALTLSADLLKSQLFSNKTLVQECLELFLCLQNEYAFEDFETVRRACLEICLEQCPVEGVNYLAIEFFKPGAYNVKQRFDILQIVAQVAQTIAFPEELNRKKCAPSTSSKVSSSKVTYYFPLSSRVNRTYVSNKYTKVAPHFFYPFYTKGIDAQNNLNTLLKSETLLLEKWLLTLGVFCYCNVNSVGMGDMCKCLLSCTWTLRANDSRSVRIAALWASNMVFSMCPPIVLSELTDELNFWLEWLRNRVQEVEEDEHKWCSSALVAVSRLNPLPLEIP